MLLLGNVGTERSPAARPSASEESGPKPGTGSVAAKCEQQAEEMAVTHGVQHWKASATTGHNVKEAFECMMREVQSAIGQAGRGLQGIRKGVQVRMVVNGVGGKGFG